LTRNDAANRSDRHFNGRAEPLAGLAMTIERGMDGALDRWPAVRYVAIVTLTLPI
jgi:hypothetical protein